MANSDLFAPPKPDELDDHVIFAPPSNEELGIPPTLGERVKTSLAHGLERVSAYSDAPTRSAVMAAISGKNPASAFRSQFGAPANTAPSGEEIAVKMGASEKPIVNQDVDLPDYPEFGPEMTISPNLYKDVRPSQAAGAAIDVAADPKNLIPYVGKGLGYAAEHVPTGAMGRASEFFGAKSGEKALASTGMTASEILKNKLTPVEGRQLVKRGIVGFGDSQAGIAKKAQSALDSSGEAIGNKISALDEAGVAVDRRKVIEYLKAKRDELHEHTANDPIVKQIDDRIASIESRIPENSSEFMSDNAAESMSPSDVGIKQSEKDRSLYDKRAKWNVESNSPPAAPEADKATAQAYRQANEEAAVAHDPALASDIKADKDTYHLLKPIAKGATRRAAVTAQSPPLNLLDAATAGAVPNPLKIPTIVARRVLSPRLNSTMAKGYDLISNALESAPESLGKYAEPLAEAAARGPQALQVMDRFLQADPNYVLQLQRVAEENRKRNPAEEQR